MCATLYPSSKIIKKSCYFGAFFAAILAILWCLGANQQLYASITAPLKAELVITDKDFKTSVLALKSVKAGNWKSARTKIQQTESRLAHDLYDWLDYTKRKDKHDFSQLQNFIRRHPDWPKQSLLKLRAEQSMPDNMSNRVRIAWFDQYFPQTSEGMESYLQALHATGQASKAIQVARRWWGTVLLTPERQTRFLSRYGQYLDRKSHIKRVDKLLFEDHYTNARKLAMLLGRDYQALVEARIALAESKAGVDNYVAAVPVHLQNDAGLVYERIRWRRRNGNDFGALQLLYSAPTDVELANASGWWHERHILTRDFLEKKDYETAYTLVSGHKQTEGLAFAQAEFLSGWIALRFLEGKEWQAFEHFEKLFYGVSSPISKARAAYWAGRASHALGHKDIADKWYRVAAKHQTTFYGQIAFVILEKSKRPPILQAPRPAIHNKSAFYNNELVQAATMLSKAGLRKDASSFLTTLSYKLEQPEEYALLADLARDLNHLHDAIRISKKGIGKNILLMDHAYPTMITHMKSVDIEWALVHGLIRQESAFDYQAQSPAGARGLMQLMPATAAEKARKLGISHRTQWLTSSPAHNIRLGSSYLEELLERFDGSYPLALAGYNGGPNRVDRWLKTYGDPRKGEIDMLDWIELIPIYETRNYVQRVMEAAYVYRQKLEGAQNSRISPLHTSMN